MSASWYEQQLMCILISVRCWKVHYPGGILFSNCYDVGNPLIIYISMFYWSSTIKTHKILHRALLLNWIIKGATFCRWRPVELFFQDYNKQIFSAIRSFVLSSPPSSLPYKTVPPYFSKDSWYISSSLRFPLGVIRRFWARRSSSRSFLSAPLSQNILTWE